ncbi:hypothetical protein EV1_034226 [Malus domestica]
MRSTCLQPQRLATRIGIIQHKSRPLHLTVQSHDLELCICDHEPYHISIVGVICPFAATHVNSSLQRLLGLVLIIDPTVILTAFDKHFNGEKPVVRCNATYPVDVIASLFVSHNTFSQSVERYYKTLDSFNANGLLPLHDLIEMASTAFGLNASEMISSVHLEGLLGHALGSIGLQVWGNDGSHGLARTILILGTASMIEEHAMLLMEPIQQAQTSKNFSDPQFQKMGCLSAKCYCKTNQPNLMWYAMVLISKSYDNNTQRYGSNLQK